MKQDTYKEAVNRVCICENKSDEYMKQTLVVIGLWPEEHPELGKLIQCYCTACNSTWIEP